jgi:hypothetical protein
MDGSLLGLVLVFYYVPTMIALWREHPRAGAIYTINFFLGWTCIGWVAALVWAFICQPVRRSDPMAGRILAPGFTAKQGMKVAKHLFWRHPA